MSRLDIIRAWRDEDYRAELAEAPEHPAGMIELSDAGLRSIQGGTEIPDTALPARCTELTRNCPSICQVFSC